jgi:hypothetical protein
MWPLMRDFRFGVVWMGQGGTRACGSRRALGAAAMDIPHGLGGSFSRTMIFDFGATIMPRAAHG